MTGPTLTAGAGGAPVLAPLLAQWDTSLMMLLERLEGLTDDEYRWAPAAGDTTRTIAWTLAHLAELCRARADYVDGAHDYPNEHPPFPATAPDALAELQGAASRWRSAVAGASAEQAVQVGYSAWPSGMDRDLPFVDIVWWMNRELIAHGSDASTVRDLYAAR